AGLLEGSLESISGLEFLVGHVGEGGDSHGEALFACVKHVVLHDLVVVLAEDAQSVVVFALGSVGSSELGEVVAEGLFYFAGWASEEGLEGGGSAHVEDG